MAHLTGKLRCRCGWLNKLILQVEETQTESDRLGMSFRPDRKFKVERRKEEGSFKDEQGD